VAGAQRKSEPRVALVYEDEHLLAVDKPAGLAVIPGRGRERSVIELLRGARADEDLRVVHRLDADTSGVMLLACGLHAQRELVRMFAHRLVEKSYLAIVSGRPEQPRGTIDRPIAADARRPERMRVSRRGKPALTDWEWLESWAGFSLLRCRPRTGRRHQIRVHLAGINLPLAVDPLYGAGEGIWLSRVKPNYRPSRQHREYPLISRLTLHAESLRLLHPATGRQMEFSAPLPKDFRATVSQLRKLA
jgi:RluA family pseudouridine synthase